MIVISDAAPIISLTKIGQLALLAKLFGNVIVTEAVFKELTTNTHYPSEIAKIKACPFIEILPVQDSEKVRSFMQLTKLDIGESESIILAQEIKADTLLIDERKGRAVAKKMGLRITGSVGILIAANQKGVLSREDAIYLVDELREIGTRISDDLYRIALNGLK